MKTSKNDYPYGKRKSLYNRGFFVIFNMESAITPKDLSYHKNRSYPS